MNNKEIIEIAYKFYDLLRDRILLDSVTLSDAEYKELVEFLYRLTKIKNKI